MDKSRHAFTVHIFAPNPHIPDSRCHWETFGFRSADRDPRRVRRQLRKWFNPAIKIHSLKYLTPCH